MAHNSLIRIAWNVLTDLHASEMAAFDAAQFASISGDAGGTWAPSSVIIIGGAGLSAGPLAALTTFNCGGVATFTASVICQDTLRVDNAATFNGNVTLGNASGDTLTVNATSAFASPAVFSSTLGVVGNASFSGSLTVAVNAGISGALAVTGAVTLGGLATLNGGAIFNGDTSFNGTFHQFHALTVFGAQVSMTAPMTCSATGRVIRQAAIGAVSGGGTASPATANVYWFNTGMATQSYALGTGSDGDELEFALAPQSTANTLTLTGGAIGGLVMSSNGSGSIFNSRWKLIAGLWQLLSISRIP